MNRKISTLLVDDEAGCIDILQRYLHKYCPRLEVVATRDTAAAAIELLNSRPVDLAFLDVHLFDANIFDLLPGLQQQRTEMIFVTAYEEYALKAFRVSALDYLLKPLESGEVVHCYEKILKRFDTPATAGPADPGMDKGKKITLRQGDAIYVVYPDDILFLKAKGIYTSVAFLHEQQLKTVLISKPINLVLAQWSAPELLRVHRSYAVNTKKVSGIRKQGAGLTLEIAGAHHIPVAKRREANFLEQYGHS